MSLLRPVAMLCLLLLAPATVAAAERDVGIDLTFIARYNPLERAGEIGG